MFGQPSTSFLDGIHKGCPQLGEGRGLATKRTKVDRGEGGCSAESEDSFQCGLCRREQGA